MSWAETKKLNSDLNVPLNEYFGTHFENYGASRYYKNQSGNTDTVFDYSINSKAMLHKLSCTAPTNGSRIYQRRLLVQINGETWVDATCSSSGSNQYTLYFKISTQAVANSDTDNTEVFPFTGIVTANKNISCVFPKDLIINSLHVQTFNVAGSGSGGSGCSLEIAYTLLE